jgi:O-antigen/teichoic acid export membrane protein
MKNYSIFRRRVKEAPWLLVVPFVGRGVNLIFTPFVLLSFGSQGFIKVSNLILISFILTTCIELGVKQKILSDLYDKSRLIQFYLKWLMATLVFFTFFIILYLVLDSNSSVENSKELLVVVLDSIINVSLNSFYLGHLQAKGRSERILTLNILIIFFTIAPRVFLLVVGNTQPWMWLLFGCIFKILLFRLPLKIFIKNLKSMKGFLINKELRIFDALSLNVIFNLLVVSTLTLDKLVGSQVYDTKEMVGYFLAFQFTSMSGSLFEQVFSRYFPKIRESLTGQEAQKNLTSLLLALFIVVTVLNAFYTILSFVVFHNLDRMFYPILILLSFQSVTWGLLLIWQNILSTINSSSLHVKYMGLAFLIDLMALFSIKVMKSSSILTLAGATSATFLICLVGISVESKYLKLKFVSLNKLVLMALIQSSIGLIIYFFKNSFIGILSIYSGEIFLVLVFVYRIKLQTQISSILGIGK